MISLEAVSKSYRVANRTVAALNNVSLQVRRGEIFGVVGHSGAGKSTLVRCLALLERPETGRVWLGGEALSTLDARALRRARQRIGLVFQHFNLLQTKSVFENVALPLRLKGETGLQLKRRVQHALARTGLQDAAQHRPGQLSGGQKQRVGIARALVHEPQVLLLDEATSALDPLATQSILQLIKQIWRDTQITTVLITHEMHVVQSLCDTVGVLHAGALVEMGPVAQVLLNPVHEATQKLVGHPAAVGLPEAVCARYKSFSPQQRHERTLVCVRAVGPAVQTPWLASCSQQSGACLTLLCGSVGAMRQAAYGALLLEIDGDVARTERAITCLVQRGFSVQRLACPL